MSSAQVGNSPQIVTSITSSNQPSENLWSKMNSPWGKVVPVSSPCSLKDVMGEQLASDMDVEEQKQIHEAILAESKFAEEQKSSEAVAGQGGNLSDAELAAKLAAEESGVDPNDEVLARYLQQEYDKEYDAMVDKVQQKLNGTSKVSISFENYKMKHQRTEALGEDEDNDDDYDAEYPEFPAPTMWEAPKPSIGNKGYAGHGKNIVTKHDKVICGRRNAERLMDFPPEFESGDGEGMDMQLPNKVYNKLKSHSQTETKKSQKVHEKKEHSTAIKAVDQKTRILLFKMVNSGFLASIDGVVNEGKEAVVFKAAGGMKDEVAVPKDVILKVYKTTMNEFRTRAKYVYGDHILSKDNYKKQNPRKIMKLWAEKESLNLRRMRRHNLPCPTPLSLKKHVLAMTCIGGEHPAPKLKEVRLSTEDMQDAYEQTVLLIKHLYHKCNLVHADLSEYNLLWHDGQVWVIDVSQAVEKENTNASDFLLRDCHNICKFFRQAGVYGVSQPEDLYMDVTNYSLEGEGAVFVAETQRYQKNDYAFDYFFEQSEALRGQTLDNEDSSDSDVEEVADEKEEVHDQAKTEKDQSGKIKKTSKKAKTKNTGSGSERWVINDSDDERT